ncbi:MAG: DUF3108 domain-containing protein [Muribaculaceae bacterium]|nr:DUF3108 domain-containing protein [Muribaculaceae bacterium]
MKTLNWMKYAMLSMVGTVMLSISVAQPAAARTYTTETLNYEIVYHWGLIWKHAANAKLTIKRTSNGGYYSELVGKTRSWADKIYPVRDTLKCWMNSNFTPTKYMKLTHEKSYYAKDVVNFSYANGTTYGNCIRYRTDRTEKASLASRGTAYDMVSVFYMLRNLDFASLQKNKSYSTVVFSGKRKETLTIKYKGSETIELRNGSKHSAYHITFTFTQEGNKKSSDDIDAYLSTGPSRIPLMLVGQLPVGEVKCYYGGAIDK